MNNELIVLMGLPRSGKSNWSKKQNLPIVNLDSIRLVLVERIFFSEVEPIIWLFAKAMIKSLFIAGNNSVIIDATNLTKERRNYWKNDNWKCKYIYFITPETICIERAKLTNQERLIPIIKDMNKNKDFLDIDFSKFYYTKNGFSQDKKLYSGKSEIFE